MSCQIRYLNSAGIDPREAPALAALSSALPDNWLLYASFQYLPPRERPMDIDALIVMDDRVLLLEVKDWNGVLTCNGDVWLVDERPRGRSPVHSVAHKARVLANVIREGIPGFRFHVDSGVLMTGTAGPATLPREETDRVFTVDQLGMIVDPLRRHLLLEPQPLRPKKAYTYDAGFDRLTRTGRRFKPKEVDWDGYRVVQENLFVHPKAVWSEHRSVLKQDTRHSAILRLWAFDRLPAHLNSPDNRLHIAHRDLRTMGYLSQIRSKLIPDGRVLEIIGDTKSEILTQHFDLRRLPKGWMALPSYLERTRDDIGWDDRVTLVQTLLNVVAELHVRKVAHRDLGLRNLWVESTTRLSLGGFAGAILPDDELPGDWLNEIAGYTSPVPEEIELSSNWQRDVYHLGLLARTILFHGEERVEAFQLESAAIRHGDVTTWLSKAIGTSASARFPTAVEMSDEFGRITDVHYSSAADESALNAFETDINPVFQWPPEVRVTQGRRIFYESTNSDSEKIAVKVWPRLFRGQNAQSDLSLLRLFQGVTKIRDAKAEGLPSFGPSGLSAMGAFITHGCIVGQKLDELGQISSLAAARLARGLIFAVIALHRAGLSHGNLDAKCIFVQVDENRSTMVIGGLFEVGDFGDATAGTPSLLPTNWEHLSGEHIDRFAAISVALRILDGVVDHRLVDCKQQLSRELQRAAIETLDTVRDILVDVLADLEKPPLPKVRVGVLDVRSEFPSDGGKYYARAYKFSEKFVRYLIFGLGCQMNVLTVPGMEPEVEITQIGFDLMRRESERCELIEAVVEIYRSQAPEVTELIELLARVTVQDGSQESVAEEQILQPPIAETILDSVEAPIRLDTSKFWRRSIELEQNLVPEVTIASDVVLTGASWIARYDILRGNFDFDPEDSVEVHVPGRKRRIGRLDVSGTDGSQLAIKELDWNLREGDVVQLVERQQQTSYDRRKRAVDRIIAKETPIKGLLDYFDTGGSAGMNAEAAAEPASIEKYGLNTGQRKAFADIAQQGPLGLLQGPPGTGKTKFIAAFVHWLATDRKAERILIASQSHEAVNNVIEAVLRTFRGFGHRPNLLRIGSKNITAAVKPYHTASVRERYGVSFSNSIRSRVSALASSIGIDRKFAQLAVDLDRQAGPLARRYQYLLEEITRGERQPDDDRRLTAALRTVGKAFKAVLKNAGVEEHASETPATALALAFENLRAACGVPEADASNMVRLIALAQEWTEALSSSSRNFEEFLAKTKTIVTGTCVGLGQTRVRIDQADFDWVIVDEAARCTPGELAVPLQLGRRVLLVGDHFQLKPMIDDLVTKELCREFSQAKVADIQRSEFERAFVSSYGLHSGQILNEQYRMAPPICDLVSSIFYKPNGVALKTSDDRIEDPFFSSADAAKLLPSFVTWIDTSSGNSHVERPDERNPWDISNLAEANAIVKLLKNIQQDHAFVGHLTSMGDDHPIGIICMYKEQRILLDRLLAQSDLPLRFRDMIRLDTVDSYQGKENAIVIVSLVRCNTRGAVGHVGNVNRCNVAMSRAKERLVIVGATRMWSRIGKKSPMRRVLEHIGGMERPSGEIIKAEAL